MAVPGEEDMEFDDLLDEPETQHIQKLGIPHEDNDDEFSR
jgi:hypothetical protein